MSGYNASQVVEIFKPKLSGWKLDTNYDVETDGLRLGALSPHGKRTIVELMAADLMLPADDLLAKFLPILKGELEAEEPKPEVKPAQPREAPRAKAKHKEAPRKHK
jgi:hypothetical protein